MSSLEAAVAEKHAHLQRMSDDKDRMQGLLDAKTVELVEVRRRGADAESAAARAGRQFNGICSVSRVRATFWAIFQTDFLAKIGVLKKLVQGGKYPIKLQFATQRPTRLWPSRGCSSAWTKCRG